MQFARAAALTCKLMSIARSAPSSAPAGQQRAQELLRAPLTRASLTRGLQHPSLAVRIPALDLLLQVLRSLAAAAPPGDGSIGWACEERDRWEAFVRSALPDPQVIVGLRASIGEGWRSVGGEKGAGEARERSGNGKGGDGMGDGSSQSGEDSSGDADMASEDGVGDDADMPSKDGVGDEADMASEGSIEEDDEGGPGVAPGREGKERGEGDRGAVRAARRAFAVAAEHHALVPAWWAESGADPAALVPQGWSDGAGADVRCAAAALGLVSRQMQPLEALQLSSLWGGALGKGGADGWRPVGWVTPGALQALAGLLRACRVRTQARRAFCGALMSTGLMGGAGAVEAACWVDAVERAGSTDASQALARFVGQAVAQCAQRPHLAFGAADRARALAALAPTSAAPSPLLVSALADGGKVLQSAKAPPEQQAAVADFLGALCQSAARASRDPAAWSTAASGAILAAFSGGLEKASAPEWVPPSETVLQGLPPSAGPLLAAFRGLRKAAEGLLDGSTAGGGGGASRANAKKRSGGDSGKKRRRAESDAEHHDRPRGSAAALEGPSFLHMPLEEALASGYAPAFVSAHLAVALGHLGDPSGAVGSAAVAAGAIRALLSEGDGVGPTGGPPASVCGARDGPSEACVGANGTEGEAGSVGKVDRDGERGGEVATGAWGEQAGDVCLRRQLGEALGRWVLEEEGLDAVVDASVDQVAAGLGSGYLELVLVLSQVCFSEAALCGPFAHPRPARVLVFPCSPPSTARGLSHTLLRSSPDWWLTLSQTTASPAGRKRHHGPCRGPPRLCQAGHRLAGDAAGERRRSGRVSAPRCGPLGRTPDQDATSNGSP